MPAGALNPIEVALFAEVCVSEAKEGRNTAAEATFELNVTLVVARAHSSLRIQVCGTYKHPELSIKSRYV